MENPKAMMIIDLSPSANFVPTVCEVYKNVIVLKQTRDNQDEERVVLGIKQFKDLLEQLVGDNLE